MRPTVNMRIYGLSKPQMTILCYDALQLGHHHLNPNVLFWHSILCRHSAFGQIHPANAIENHFLSFTSQAKHCLPQDAKSSIARPWTIHKDASWAYVLCHSTHSIAVHCETDTSLEQCVAWLEQFFHLSWARLLCLCSIEEGGGRATSDT